MKHAKLSYSLMAFLLVTAAWMIIRQSDRSVLTYSTLSNQDRISPTKHARSAGLRTNGSNSLSPTYSGTNKVYQPQDQSNLASTRGKSGPSAGGDRLLIPHTSSKKQLSEGSEKTVISDAPNLAKPGRGIQLAENVRLPAAIMALSDPSFKNQTPQQDAALRQVVDRFYKDLADVAEVRLANEELSSDQLIRSENGEETIVIRPGPDVDKARQRANEIFRALFGDERYNQVTMQSAMEAMLAPESGNN